MSEGRPAQEPVPSYLRPGFWIGLIVPIAVLGIVGFVGWQVLSPSSVSTTQTEGTVSATVSPSAEVSLLTTLAPVSSTYAIHRDTNSHTTIPERGPDWVVPYTVQKGDTVDGIAKQFNLKPESVVWGNPEMLADDANILKPGMVLNILPIDGAFYKWKAKDTIESVAMDWNTTADAILNWPGNHLNPLDPDIWPGTYVILPGGWKPFEWEAVMIRNGNSSTFALGAGQCPNGYSGPSGGGAWVWPTTSHYLSGTDFMPPAHPGIDIAIYLGQPIFAVDMGVVVFAGWSQNRDGTPGYGNLVIIDHLNGFHSFYAHLLQINVSCGTKIAYPGYPIALGGSTGNSTGPHLHFEIRYKGAPQNPWGLLP